MREDEGPLVECIWRLIIKPASGLISLNEVKRKNYEIVQIDF